MCRSSIDFIYKQLTRSPVHPLGGTAYLALEVDDEPYLGGVKYTAMPPTKRFRDMEQLSGVNGAGVVKSKACGLV
jgi:structural maintenance of chromosome 1